MVPLRRGVVSALVASALVYYRGLNNYLPCWGFLNILLAMGTKTLI